MFLSAILLSLPVQIEKREIITVIDTGIVQNAYINQFLCEGLSKDFTGTGLKDNNGHGTNIAHIIARYIDPKKHCLAIVKYWHDDKANGLAWLKSLAYAYTIGTKYVNMSVNGDSYIPGEYMILKALLNRNVSIFVAAGNDSKNLSIECKNYPACYNLPLTVVGSIGSYSNYGGPVTVVEDGNDVTAGGYTMSGTSMATAIALGKSIKRREL